MSKSKNGKPTQSAQERADGNPTEPLAVDFPAPSPPLPRGPSTPRLVTLGPACLSTNTSADHKRLVEPTGDLLSPLDRLLTFKQAATALNRPYSAIQRAARKGIIPVYSPFSSRKLVRLRDILALLDGAKPSSTRGEGGL